MDTTPPKGFERIPLWDEKRTQFSHYRKIPHGWDYWRERQPHQFQREVWTSDAARCITTHKLP
jgi:hypothetical protein